MLEQSPKSSVDLREGMKHEKTYCLTPEVHQGFVETFEDTNPLHWDGRFAQEQGFEAPVMHGAILNGFLSHFIGMEFPGPGSLILNSDLRFVRPIYLGDQLKIEAKVGQVSPSLEVLELLFSVFNTNRMEVSARGRFRVRYKNVQF